MRYLLDTNVVSELIARRPEERVVQWIDNVDPNGVFISVITIGEIRKGMEKLPPSPRKDDVQRWLAEDLLIRFGNRVLALEVEAMLVWGSLTARLETEGGEMPAMDALLAAQALRDDLCLVTRNENDFKHSRIEVFNPWK